MSGHASACDVCVIGAGLAGLSAAALLRARGVDVRVIERASRPGGRAAVSRRDGYTLDFGIHSLRFGHRSPAARVLRSLGEQLELCPQRDSESYVIAGGKMIRRFDDPQAFLATPELTVGQKLAVAAMVSKLILWHPASAYATSLAEAVGPLARDPAVKEVMRFIGFAIMAPDPERASAGEVSDFLRAQALTRVRVADPRGGMGQIVDKLVRKLGPGRLRLENPMRRMAFSGRRVDRLECDQGTQCCRAVLYAAPLQQLFDVADPAFFPAGLVHACRALEPTSGLTLDFGLKRPVSDLSGSLIDLDRGAMGKFPSNTDPGLAPAGKQLASWLVMLEPGACASKERIEEAERALRALIERFCPELFAQVEWERRLVHPIMDGVHLRVGQAFPDRQPVRCPQLDNLFFAGDTVRARGCSGDIAFQSAMEAAEAILGFLR
ncbi:MAG: FAD-dependent oxidoreductase [Deltaproteobacteria bacterium]|nr:FAD-dependent oxidoreductase [Deltaproteobacteria bacterium]